MNHLILKQVREDFKFTQQEMADKLGVSRSYYSKLENGKAEMNDTVKAKATKLKEELDRLRAEQKAHYKAQQEGFKKAQEVQEEKKQVIKDIEKVRKAQDFNIQIEPSVDMIWLTKHLRNEEGKEFLDWISHNIRLNGIVVEQPYGGDGVKSGRRVWDIHNTDGNIHVDYGFYVQGKVEAVLKVQFNPNKVKWDNPYLIGLMKYLGENPVCRKFDVCKDYVGVSTQHVLDYDNAGKEVKTIIPNNPDGGITYYVGDMNNNGTRLYDKRAELLQKDKKEIAFDVSRMETRVKLPKALELSEIVGTKVKVRYPVFTVINKDLSLLENGESDLDMVVYCQVIAVLDGKVSISRLSRAYKDKVRKFIDKMVTDTITLTAVDIQMAMLRFQQSYDFTYFSNYGDAVEELNMM